MTEYLSIDGYRVANVDIRGCGDSSLGGPAVIIGQSISDGTATITAAPAPDSIAGTIELAPFTPAQPFDLGGLIRVKRFRTGCTRMAQVIMRVRLADWTKYLDVALPIRPADRGGELARIETKLSEPGRMKTLQSMCKTSPADAGRQLPNVKCPVLIIEGGADPDWADPRAEGEKIIADLPRRLGELVVIDGAGHYPHVQVPDKVLALTQPFLNRTLTHA